MFQAFVATSLGTVGGFNRFKFRHRQGGDKKNPPLASSPLRDTPEADAVMEDALNRARKGRKGKRRRRKRKKTVPRKVTPKEQRTKSPPERCAYFFAKRDEKSFSFIPIRFFCRKEGSKRRISAVPSDLRRREDATKAEEGLKGDAGKMVKIQIPALVYACSYFHNLICSLLSGNTESLENKGGRGGGRRNKRGQPQHFLPTKDLESPLRNH